MSFGYRILGFGSGGGATSPYLVATGGTITCSGNDKIHTFTGPGTFTVCSAGTCAANNLVSYMVVAGGGGGGGTHGGGAGAGGFREVESPVTPYTASPLEGYPTPGNRITVTATSYPIATGAGGTAGVVSGADPTLGGDSTFSCITSAGGGKGASEAMGDGRCGMDGGSGGGGSYPAPLRAGGCGNTPPFTPSQGSGGGAAIQYGPNPYPVWTGSSGGGGGATEAGVGAASNLAGRGGAGTTTEITASSVAYAGGGGGGSSGYGTGVAVGAASPCGTGGAGSPAPGNSGCGGTIYKGGGGGGGYAGPPTGGSPGGGGGSGVVVIRYKFQGE
jgi:hypothetical protein